MTTEYLCSRGWHWAPEVRVPSYGELTCCEKCSGRNWQSYMPVVREVNEPRYIAILQMSGDWNVLDSLREVSMDYGLTELQVEEITALRNKWEEDK